MNYGSVGVGFTLIFVILVISDDQFMSFGRHLLITKPTKILQKILFGILRSACWVQSASASYKDTLNQS